MRLTDNGAAVFFASIYDAAGQILSHFDGRHDRTINGVYVVEWQTNNDAAFFSRAFMTRPESFVS
jgi:hypothetical protein